MDETVEGEMGEKWEIDCIFTSFSLLSNSTSSKSGEKLAVLLRTLTLTLLNSYLRRNLSPTPLIFKNRL